RSWRSSRRRALAGEASPGPPWTSREPTLLPSRTSCSGAASSKGIGTRAASINGKIFPGTPSETWRREAGVPAPAWRREPIQRGRGGRPGPGRRRHRGRHRGGRRGGGGRGGRRRRGRRGGARLHLGTAADQPVSDARDVAEAGQRAFVG